MLWRRTFSAIILIPVVLSGFLSENIYLRFLTIAFLALVMIVGTYEGCMLMRMIGHRANQLVATLAAIALSVSAAYGRLEHLPLILAGALVLCMGREIVRPRPDFKGASGNIAGTIFILVWVGMPLAMALDLYVSSGFGAVGREGRRWLKLLLGAVWMTDTMAYFAGLAFGRKFIQQGFSSASPKKSWEGAVGGLLGGGVLLPVALSAIWPAAYPPARLLEFVLVACLLSMLTQLGDLAESLVKREAGTKDSGKTGTGHGGVLDRIDGMLFALVGLWCYIWIRDPHLLLPK